MWGQNDSVYASFALLSLYFVIRDRPALAAFSFGIAFSIKLQSLFIAPVIVGYLIAKGKRGWSLLFVIPLVYVATLIPAFAAGGSFTDLLFTYVRQSVEYPELSLHAPSVFSFVDDSKLSAFTNTMLSYAGLTVAFATAVYTLVTTVYHSTLGNVVAQKILFLALLAAVTVPFFLPHMHERYFYLADILSTLFAFSFPRYWLVPILVVGASFFSYLPFLTASVPSFAAYLIPEMILGFFMLVTVIILWNIVLRKT
jgi:Gpi18-like mannosyltransferase